MVNLPTYNRPLSPLDFIRISEAEFKSEFSCDKYKWHHDHKEPHDVSWWEAHAKFMIDVHENRTVGFMRTSSWNPEKEFYRLRRLTDANLATAEKVVDTIIEHERNVEPWIGKKISDSPGFIELAAKVKPDYYAGTSGSIEVLADLMQEIWHGVTDPVVRKLHRDIDDLHSKAQSSFNDWVYRNIPGVVKTKPSVYVDVDDLLPRVKQNPDRVFKWSSAIITIRYIGSRGYSYKVAVAGRSNCGWCKFKFFRTPEAAETAAKEIAVKMIKDHIKK